MGAVLHWAGSALHCGVAAELPLVIAAEHWRRPNALQERPDAELKRDIWRALEGAISEDVSSEEERAAMLRLWRREVATA